MILLRPDVLSIFQRQHGLASIDQLLATGVSRSSIDRARRRGAIETLLPGVFILTGTELTFRGKCTAALLFFGPNAYLFGKTAAALHGCRGVGLGPCTSESPRTLTCTGSRHGSRCAGRSGGWTVM